METDDFGRVEGGNALGADPVQAHDRELRSLIEVLKAEIAALQPMVEAARQQFDAISTAKAQIEGLLAEIQVSASDSQKYTVSQQVLVREIEGHRATAEDDATAIKTLLAATEVVKVNAIAAESNAANAASEAADAAARATRAAEKSEELATAIEATKDAADHLSVEIDEVKSKALGHTATLRGLATKAEAVDARITAYEAKLAEFDQKAAAQLETITGLLPGATSAGLASAFDLRRQSFLKPSTRWQWLFVWSVIALVVLAATGFWGLSKGDGVPGYDAILSMWLVRLPIAAALIWLALHASRESALAKRLEEDYGFKAAMAASFQGFQRQMADIGDSAGGNSPLRKLCEDTLATIASPPGRIYEKHSLTSTPASEAVDAAKSMSGALGPARKDG